MARQTTATASSDPATRQSKLFVLDTNVLLHDPTSVYRFEEHDVFLPIMTLEELDNHKKGISEIARNARQVTRTLDEIVSSMDDQAIDEGIRLDEPSRRLANGRLFLQTEAIASELPAGLPTAKADNQILAVVIHLQRHHPKRPVILVSKDINMRIKARTLGLQAQDYFNDKVLEDTDLLYTGMRELTADFWDEHAQGMESWKQDGHTLYRLKGPLCAQLLPNQFLVEEGARPLQAMVRDVSGTTAEIATLTDYTHARNSVWGITARNREQNFALNLLM
ncbi:MAG: PhoH family protein, partial [Candidatus Accumulibacter sp.]|nr:PhoH family protein [Accumulibacter sp.]